MSLIDKTVLISEQYYTTSKKGPLDAKQTPADTYEELIDLSRIPRTQRYQGLTVTVLNGGNPVEYWLVGGTTNACWKVKTGNIVPTKSSLSTISPSACTVGMEMIVQNDESNDNSLTKYWVTSIENGNVVWTKKEYGVTIAGDDMEQNNQ